MIEPPPGWVRHHGANLLTLYPPEGGGRVRCHQRLYPMRSLSRVVRTALEGDPAFTVSAIRAPLQIVTNEGEYGAWVEIVGTREDRPAWHLVGAVFADEFTVGLDTMIVATDAYARLEATAKELLLGSTLGLGTRRRRFVYTPPPGWHALPAGLVANWYPLEFPRDHATMVVFPANPTDVDPVEAFDAWLATETAGGFEVQGAIEHESFASDAGLAGRRYRLRGRQQRGPQTALLHRELVLCSAARALYVMQLDILGSARIDAHRATFTAVARSAQPLPAPGKRTIGSADIRSIASVVSHWID